MDTKCDVYPSLPLKTINKTVYINTQTPIQEVNNESAFEESNIRNRIIHANNINSASSDDELIIKL
jgi:hypothetical protein